MVIDTRILLPLEDSEGVAWDSIPSSEEQKYYNKNKLEVDILSYNEKDKYMLIKTPKEWSIKNGFTTPVTKEPIVYFECELYKEVWRFRKHQFEFIMF